MPQLGETVAEGKIINWFKSVGDEVKPGDDLFEIETDKTSMEVPATTAGTLTEIRFGIGEVAKVGAAVAVIGEAGALVRIAPSTSQSTAARTPPLLAALAPTPRSVPMDPWGEVRSPKQNFGPARQLSGVVATPLARRIASQRCIDLSSMSGSGPHGRIVARDVEVAANEPISVVLATDARAASVKALYDGVAYEEVQIDAMRRTIARRLVEAKQSVPHFHLISDVDIGQLISMRQNANAAAPRGKDAAPAFKLSLNDFIIKAWASALQQVPAANAVWAEDCMLRFTRSDVGVAVAIGGGLLTPVIRNADIKSITAVAAEMRDFAERARARKLKPNEYQGGSSAVSNLGMYGVREFSAIINPPHATILAVGAGRRAVVEGEEGVVKVASLMTVTLSCDHRVVDGALGAELLTAFKGLIEKPITTLV